MIARKWIAVFLSFFLVFSWAPSLSRAQPPASQPKANPPAKSSVKKAYLSILRPDAVPGGLSEADLRNALLATCFDGNVTETPLIDVDMSDGIILGTCDIEFPYYAGTARYTAKIDGNFNPKSKEIYFTLKATINLSGVMATVKDGKELGRWDESQHEVADYTALGEWIEPTEGFGTADFKLDCLIMMSNLQGDVPYGVGGRCPGSDATDSKAQSDDGNGIGKVMWRLDLVDTCGDIPQSFDAQSDSKIKIVKIEAEQNFLDATVIRKGCEVEAEKGMQLTQDDEVRTGYKTYMYIDLIGHDILIPAMSAVRISTFFLGDVEEMQTEILLGGLSARRIKEFRPTRFSVKTPTLTASVRGTTFTVNYDPDQKVSTVQVEEGIVDVTPANTALAPLTLEANQQVTVSLKEVSAVQPYTPPAEVQSSFSLRAWFAGERMWIIFSLLTLFGILLIAVGIALIFRKSAPIWKALSFAMVLLPGVAVAVFSTLALIPFFR